jgi:hypothetical protein
MRLRTVSLRAVITPVAAVGRERTLGDVGARALGLHLIDSQGRERVYLSSDLGAAALASDPRVLAGES